jgi:hypothetical protein
MTSRTRKQAWIVGLAALLLLIVRVDIWWWGVEMPPVLFGSLNLTWYAVDTLKLEEED